jgi:hypothetical protein
MTQLKSKSLISRLSVGRKLILIYALDLSAVIFVSTILINEKFIAIDFSRKEIIGNHYIAAVRDAIFEENQTKAADAVYLAETLYGKERGDLGTKPLAQALAEALLQQQAVAGNGLNHQAYTKAAQALITRIGNQSN